jgi:hypothetical protein
MKILLSGRIRSGWVSDHLVSGHFGFWVVSGPVGSGIRLSSVESFRVSGRVGSGIWSSSIGSFQVSGRIKSGQVVYQVI